MAKAKPKAKAKEFTTGMVVKFHFRPPSFGQDDRVYVDEGVVVAASEEVVCLQHRKDIRFVKVSDIVEE